MICSVVYRFRAISSSPRQSSEIAGFAQSTWSRFSEAGQVVYRSGELPKVTDVTSKHLLIGVVDHKFSMSVRSLVGAYIRSEHVHVHGHGEVAGTMRNNQG